MSSTQQITIRVRLSNAAWTRVKERATYRHSSPGLYADMIFRYLLHENFRLPPFQPTSMDAEEEVYFELEIPPPTRERLARGSERLRASLASYSGQLLAAFLNRFERDPRDLAMVYYISSRLDNVTVLTVEEILTAIDHCESNPEVRLPQGYLNRWLHSRLRTLIANVRHGENTVPLTLDLLEDMLQRRQR